MEANIVGNYSIALLTISKNVDFQIAPRPKFYKTPLATPAGGVLCIIALPIWYGSGREEGEECQRIRTSPAEAGAFGWI